MTVEDVMTDTLTRLESEVPIPWYEWFVPDDMKEEHAANGAAYGVIAVQGPFETSRRYWNVCGIDEQPFAGSILVGVTAPTSEAVKIQAGRVFTALRGWSPGAGTSAFTSSPARGYEPVDGKFEPTLVTRQMLFSFTTGL